MLKKLKPKRLGERAAHQNLPKLKARDLLEGDILIAKVWGNDAFDAAFVRASQAVFSHVRGGSSQSEHVLLNCLDGGTFTVETLSRGTCISYDVERRDHVVYRCSDRLLAREASRVGKALAGVANIFVGTDVGDSPALIDAKRGRAFAQHYDQKKAEVKYRNPVGMAASVFRSKRQGRFAEARIARLHDIAYGNKAATGIAMICSEFIASCYEVAAAQLDSEAPFGRGVDPRAMTAKALEAVLNRSGSLFKLEGRFAGTKLTPAVEKELLGRLITVYRLICSEMGQSISATDAYTQLTGDHALWIQYKHDAPDLQTWQQGIARAIQLNL